MKRAESEARQRVSGILMNKLIDAHPFEVPPTLLEYQADQLLESVARDLYMRGVDPRGQETSWWSNVREQLKPQATRDLRASMLMEAIAEREKIEVSDDEIQAEIAAIAGASRQTMEQVRDALTKQGGERSIADRLRNRKALDLVLENARITDEEWREEMPDEDEPANEQQAVPEQALPETQTAADASPEASRQTDEAPDPEQADAASSES